MSPTPPPPRRDYAVLYADPPWTFATYSAKGRGRCPDAHYEVMSIDGLKALPVADWAAADCALLMWATSPLLPRAFEVMAAWGFTYKSVAFTWAKQNKRSPSFFVGLGYWTRANCEYCLLGTRGAPKRRARDVRQLIVAPRREHSRKPDETYERIERLLGGPYLELFARESRPGWDAWGLQAGLFDQGEVATRRWPSVGDPTAASTPTPLDRS